jgi:dTDP-4-dehydrorhamnose 3,5-epimerase
VKVETTPIPGVLVIEPKRFGDARGFFVEQFHSKRYAEHGISGPFVQDNYSRSAKGTLRGLHYQLPHAQGKLVQVVAGAVWDVAVDIRRGSPAFGKWFGLELSAENGRQLWVPPGLAHGFCVTSDSADFVYKCTDFYSPESERGVAWNDPELGITWPVEHPILSKKDEAAARLKDAAPLPVFTE